MKKIAAFCIPAHGHTNPMLPVVAQLVRLGHIVRFYSFHEFEEKIRATGAEFIACDPYLPPLSKEEETALKNVSTTEMTIQDIRITLSMNEFLEKEFREFAPDVIYTDSVCFWGKLNAWKYQIPMVVSTSTFAFNQLSSTYMKNSPKEMVDMIFGLPRISKELKTLKPYGYEVKSALALVSSDNQTDSVVYTSRRFQPYAESYSDHYLFVGPSVFSEEVPQKNPDRPLIYVSMGTVINERPDFYRNCIAAVKSLNADLIISYGRQMDPSLLGELPDNVKAYPYVNQLEVLAKASVFITHCGMNSVSESLYMATPMVLYPQTGEQKAVARRVAELEAGIPLTEDTTEGILKALQEILSGDSFAKAARECHDDFRSCPGTDGAAEFILSAPHSSEGLDVISRLNIANGKFQGIYWGIMTILFILSGIYFGKTVTIPLVIIANILMIFLKKPVQNRNYEKLTEKRPG